MSVHRKDKKVIQLICNSQNAMSGSTTNDAKFFVDWNVLLEPDTPYHLHFTYLGGNNLYFDSTTGIGNAAFLWSNFTTKSYIVPNTSAFSSTSSGQPVSSGIIGLLFPQLIDRPTRTTFIQSTTYDNNEVWMERRPNCNIFNIKIIKTDYSLWTDSTGAVPANWTLTLHFTKAYSGIYKEITKPNVQLVVPLSYATTITSGQRRFICSFENILDMRKKYMLNFVAMAGLVSSLTVTYIGFNFCPLSYRATDDYSNTSMFPLIGRYDRQQYGNTNANTANLCSVKSNQPVLIDPANMRGGYFTFTAYNYQFLVQNSISPSEHVFILNFTEL